MSLAFDIKLRNHPCCESKVDINNELEDIMLPNNSTLLSANRAEASSCTPEQIKSLKFQTI